MLGSESRTRRIPRRIRAVVLVSRVAEDPMRQRRHLTTLLFEVCVCLGAFMSTLYGSDCALSAVFSPNTAAPSSAPISLWF